MKKLKHFFKTHKNAKHVILGIIITITVVLSGFIYGEDSVFLIKLPFNNAVVQFMYSNIPTVLTTYFIITGAFYVNFAAHYALHKTFNSNQRSETILKMLYSFSKYGIFIITGIIILTVWGVDSGALLASAGGLALVVGLGAQSLIADVLAGVFIVFEGEFNVGDIVIVDNYRGKVLAIGIRSTKIRDIYGDIKTINNSQITTVINKTKELSMADVTVGINYGESIEKVEAIFRKEIKHIKDKIPEAKEDIAYLGVSDLSASSVDLLFITYCQEEHVMAVKRKIRRELKLIFDKYKIEIPYQHITLEKNDGFKSQVDFNVVDTSFEEPKDFENLLFNKQIPQKEALVKEKVVVEEEVKPKPKKKKNTEDEYVVNDEEFYKNYQVETITPLVANEAKEEPVNYDNLVLLEVKDEDDDFTDINLDNNVDDEIVEEIKEPKKKKTTSK